MVSPVGIPNSGGEPSSRGCRLPRAPFSLLPKKGAWNRGLNASADRMVEWGGPVETNTHLAHPTVGLLHASSSNSRDALPASAFVPAETARDQSRPRHSTQSSSPLSSRERRAPTGFK